MENNSLKPRHFVPMLGLDKYMKEVGAYGGSAVLDETAKFFGLVCYNLASLGGVAIGLVYGAQELSKYF